MNSIKPIRHAFAFVFLLSLHAASFAAGAIYKCTAASGAVTFSAKPCAGSAKAKKIEPRVSVVSAEPILPGNIPGRSGAISPAPTVDTTPRRTPMPQVLESCRLELFSLKRGFDTRFIELEQNLKSARAAMAQNTAELGAAQTSKVGLEWGLMLAEQRRAIEPRLRNTEAALALFFPDEKKQFEEIAKRCEKK